VGDAWLCLLFNCIESPGQQTSALATTMCEILSKLEILFQVSPERFGSGKALYRATLVVRKTSKTINALVEYSIFRSFPDTSAGKPTRFAQRSNSMPFGDYASQPDVYFFFAFRHNGGPAGRELPWNRCPESQSSFAISVTGYFVRPGALRSF
jgi:hypothetical protein